MAARLATYSRAGATFQPRASVKPPKTATILKFPPRIGNTLARTPLRGLNVFSRPGLAAVARVGLGGYGFQLAEELWNINQSYYYMREFNKSLSRTKLRTDLNGTRCSAGGSVIQWLNSCGNFVQLSPGNVPGALKLPAEGATNYTIVDITNIYKSGSNWAYNYTVRWSVTGGRPLNRFQSQTGRQVNENPLTNNGPAIFPALHPNLMPGPGTSVIPDPTALPRNLPGRLVRALHALQHAIGVRQAGYRHPGDNPAPFTPPKPGNPPVVHPNDDPLGGVDPLPRHERRPPGPNVKERKPKKSVPRIVASIMNLVTETDDWFDAAIDAMPKKLRCKFYSPKNLHTTAHKAAFIYSNWQHVDMEKFVENAVYNQVQDYLIGRLSRYEQKQMQEMFEKHGYAAVRMPSTMIGGGLRVIQELSPKKPSPCSVN